MNFIILIAAGLFEVGGVYGISLFHQKKNMQSLTFMIGSFVISFILLKIVMLTIPMGTAYAIWTGIGAAGASVVGMLFFDEPVEWKRILFLSIIIASVVGLKLFT